jgi:hypothetical protein
MRTVPEQIADLIRSIKPAHICDACIQNELSLERQQQAQEVTSAFEHSADFERTTGICSVCGQQKTVIRAAELPPPPRVA